MFPARKKSCLVLPKLWLKQTHKKRKVLKMSVQERFILYTTFDTQSDENSPTTPSTQKQLLLAAELEKELKALNIEDVKVQDGTVYGVIPATNPGMLPIGFLAHMDTASELSGANVKAVIIENYDGKTIKLNEEYEMSPEEFPVLNQVVGDDLIVTDGTTLLGADDKAGIAIIMQAIEEILNEKPKHGDIYVAFTPDEEIGRGVEKFDLNLFKPAYAYTVDGGNVTDVDYETFNAAQAVIEIQGKSIHPGTAKDKMINASLVAIEFNNMLPENEIPAKTEGREGFYHLVSIDGNVDHAKLIYIIRDHDKEIFENRKKTIEKIADKLNEQYPESVHVDIHDQYYNMKQYMKVKDEKAVDRAYNAIKALNLVPVSTPVRGGTDGAMLTAMGLFTPNLGTGSANHHGRYEFADIQKMQDMVKIVKNIIENE